VIGWWSNVPGRPRAVSPDGPSTPSPVLGPFFWVDGLRG
jgi:hypothetical protein